MNAAMLARLAYYPSYLGFQAMWRLGWWSRWDWVNDQVLLGRRPLRREMSVLQKLGVTSIVNLCAEFDGHRDLLIAHGFTQLHLPTVDYTCPSAEHVHAGVAFVEEQVSRGRKVYVHCKAGQGRSAKLITCYLVAQGMAPEQADRHVRAARPHVIRALHRSGCVQDYLARLERLRRACPGPSRLSA